MPETVAGRNERLNDYIADITAISLHTGVPNDSGSNEVTGGAPAYARKTPAYSAASAGATNLTASLVFDIPTGVTVQYYGLWKSTTFLGYEPLSANEAFAAQGTYTLTSAAITAP
jgi:hypothetical protein